MSVASYPTYGSPLATHSDLRQLFAEPSARRPVLIIKGSRAAYGALACAIAVVRSVAGSIGCGGSSVVRAGRTWKSQVRLPCRGKTPWAHALLLREREAVRGRRARQSGSAGGVRLRASMRPAMPNRAAGGPWSDAQRCQRPQPAGGQLLLRPAQARESRSLRRLALRPHEGSTPLRGSRRIVSRRPRRSRRDRGWSWGRTQDLSLRPPIFQPQ